MGWWGKLAGGAFGFMLGGPIGALIGAAFGHNFDKGLKQADEDSSAAGQERIQTAFFTTTFSVMGYLAKADGHVSKAEIRLAEHVMSQMNLSPEMRKTAIRLFNEGKSPDFPLDEVLAQFRQECRRRVTLIQMFLEILLQAAYADGAMDQAERAVLLHVCGILGISEFVFNQLDQRIRAQHYGYQQQTGSEYHASPSERLADAYATLSIDKSATDAEVKKAYRRLMSQHHPDKLVSKGLPDEMVKLAEQKTTEIRQAYETIKTDRGF